VYPNPARDAALIEIVDGISLDTSLRIWDISGAQLVTTTAFHKKFVWNIENLVEGIYFYFIAQGDGSSLQT